MDGDTLVETVRADRATELDRLGSEKSLVATTTARLDRASVLAAAHDAERRAAETFAAWAADETDDDARAAFDRIATQEQAHADRVADLQGEDAVDADPAPDALHEHLRGLDSTPERVAAGLVARPLVSDRSLLQVVNFFVNEADETAADVFREFRSETRALVDDGAARLDSCCDGDADWDRAAAAADRAVAVAYAEYEERLEGMGVDPKPVC
jgi:hypothetical protein